MATSLARIQYDRPLRDRAADQLRSDARRAALCNATAAELSELGTRLSCASHRDHAATGYATRIAPTTLTPIKLNSLASLRHQAEKAEAEVASWWADRCPEPPPPAAVDALHRRWAAETLTIPPGLPVGIAPCDGRPVPDGYRWLGDTRGNKQPDGSRGLPRALFLRLSDETVWVRARLGRNPGELVGYSGIPVAEVLGVRGS